MHQFGRGWFEFRQEEREGDFPPRPFVELPAFERLSRRGLIRVRSIEDRLRDAACCV
jgi:hypothetical protein